MKKKKKKLFFKLIGIFLFFFIIFLSFKYFPRDFSETEIRKVEINGKVIEVDLALTSIEQEQGLSGRKNLIEAEGLLFVFKKLDNHYFWMKDMLFAIDIIWIDQNKNIIFIEKNVLPESYPSIFGSNQNSLYVLEVLSGFSEKNNLEIGQKVKFLP
jgi:uncharacterized membrane protein (UPF0127 family)